MRKKIGLSLAALGPVLNPHMAIAAGYGGELVPDRITLEGGEVFVSSNAFQNPDGCDHVDVVKIVGATAAETDRMLSLLQTSIASGKHLAFWFSGCGPAPWYASVPRVTTLALVK